MVAHVHTGLVDIGGAAEGGVLPLQHQHPLPPLSAEQGGIQTVQSGPNDNFVPAFHGFTIRYASFYPSR